MNATTRDSNDSKRRGAKAPPATSADLVEQLRALDGEYALARRRNVAGEVGDDVLARLRERRATLVDKIEATREVEAAERAREAEAEHAETIERLAAESANYSLERFAARRTEWVARAADLEAQLYALAEEIEDACAAATGARDRIDREARAAGVRVALPQAWPVYAVAADIGLAVHEQHQQRKASTPASAPYHLRQMIESRVSALAERARDMIQPRRPR